MSKSKKSSTDPKPRKKSSTDSKHLKKSSTGSEDPISTATDPAHHENSTSSPIEKKISYQDLKSQYQAAYTELKAKKTDERTTSDYDFEIILAYLSRYFSTDSIPEDFFTRMASFLTRRWLLIAASEFSYTYAHDSQATAFCKLIAEYLHQEKPEKLVYQYLMPTLVYVEDVFLPEERDSLDKIPLYQLRLTADLKGLLPVSVILESKLEDDLSSLFFPYHESGAKARLLGTDDLSGAKARLLGTEDLKSLFPAESLTGRVLLDCRSKYKTWLEKNVKTNFGKALESLIQGLRLGRIATYNDPSHAADATDMRAGEAAYGQLPEFFSLWQNLPRETQEAYKQAKAKNTEPLGYYLDLIAHGLGREATNYCVNLLTANLSAILREHPEFYLTELDERNVLLAEYQQAVDDFYRSPGRDQLITNPYSLWMREMTFSVPLSLGLYEDSPTFSTEFPYPETRLLLLAWIDARIEDPHVLYPLNPNTKLKENFKLFYSQLATRPLSFLRQLHKRGIYPEELRSALTARIIEQKSWLSVSPSHVFVEQYDALIDWQSFLVLLLETNEVRYLRELIVALASKSVNLVHLLLAAAQKERWWLFEWLLTRQPIHSLELALAGARQDNFDYCLRLLADLSATELDQSKLDELLSKAYFMRQTAVVRRLLVLGANPLAFPANNVNIMLNMVVSKAVDLLKALPDDFFEKAERLAAFEQLLISNLKNFPRCLALLNWYQSRQYQAEFKNFYDKVLEQLLACKEIDAQWLELAQLVITLLPQNSDYDKRLAQFFVIAMRQDKADLEAVILAKITIKSVLLEKAFTEAIQKGGERYQRVLEAGCLTVKFVLEDLLLGLKDKPELLRSTIDFLIEQGNKELLTALFEKLYRYGEVEDFAYLLEKVDFGPEVYVNAAKLNRPYREKNKPIGYKIAVLPGAATVFRDCLRASLLSSENTSKTPWLDLILEHKPNFAIPPFDGKPLISPGTVLSNERLEKLYQIIEYHQPAEQNWTEDYLGLGHLVYLCLLNRTQAGIDFKRISQFLYPGVALHSRMSDEYSTNLKSQKVNVLLLAYWACQPDLFRKLLLCGADPNEKSGSSGSTISSSMSVHGSERVYYAAILASYVHKGQWADYLSALSAKDFHPDYLEVLKKEFGMDESEYNAWLKCLTVLKACLAFNTGKSSSAPEIGKQSWCCQQGSVFFFAIKMQHWWICDTYLEQYLKQHPEDRSQLQLEMLLCEAMQNQRFAMVRTLLGFKLSADSLSALCAEKGRYPGLDLVKLADDWGVTDIADKLLALGKTKTEVVEPSSGTANILVAEGLFSNRKRRSKKDKAASSQADHSPANAY